MQRVIFALLSLLALLCLDACAAFTRARPSGEPARRLVLALDGIDELLGGFVTRPRSRLRCEEDAVLVVDPDDVADWWRVDLGPRPAVTTRRRGAADEGDWELDGTAVELYLALWNRGRRPGVGPDLETAWRERAAVTWS